MAEDEEQVRELAVEILSEDGYDVVSAANGDEALHTLTIDGAFDLLLTDVKMPGTLDGWALAKEAKSLRPNLRVIYMTAYATLPPDGSGAGYGPVLPKPWRPNQLLKCVRRAL